MYSSREAVRLFYFLRMGAREARQPALLRAERKLAAKCVGWLCLSEQPTRVPRLLVTICFQMIFTEA